MDKREVRKDGRVFSVKELPVTEVYRDNDYQLELYPNAEATDTMHLVLGKLIPSVPSMPYFVFRWDYKQDQFDVDIENVSKKIKKKFNAQIDGYSGHHPNRFVDLKGRCIEVDINLPNKKVFQGMIRVHVVKEVAMNIILDIDSNGIRFSREFLPRLDDIM